MGISVCDCEEYKAYPKGKSALHDPGPFALIIEANHNSDNNT
jgi:hypothetical protein